jgi:putative transposase
MTFPSLENAGDLYFVTATITRWTPVLANENYIRIVLDSFSWLNDHNRILLFAFVIMPTHLHCILKPINCSIGEILQQFGSFTAHQIIARLKIDQQTDILDELHTFRRSEDRQFSVWQDIQAKNIFTQKYLEQKLEYIHNNPVSNDSNLSQDRSDYAYSSACFYDKGIEPVIPIDDLHEWLSKE